MLPLYYALMKYYTTVDDACVEDAMEALKGTYSNFKQFKKKALVEALMTAKSNGLLDESRVELDANNELRVYYKVNDYGTQMIRDYIKG